MLSLHSPLLLIPQFRLLFVIIIIVYSWAFPHPPIACRLPFVCLRNGTLKTVEKKFEIKIKNARRKIDIRARDKHDFECWALVLQRAISWKGAPRTDTFLNVGTDGLIEAMDLDLEMEEEDDILDSLDNEEEFSKLRNQKREEVFKKVRPPRFFFFSFLFCFREMTSSPIIAPPSQLIELKALHDKLATQAPFAGEPGTSGKKKKKEESDPQRFLQVAKEALNVTAYFIGILENERDTWKNKHNVAVLERAQMEESLKQLAKQHQRLEKKTGAALHTQAPDALHMVSFEAEPAESEQEEAESGDEEFFDAIDSGPSFVMPPEPEHTEREVASRKISQADFQRRTNLPAFSP